MPGGLMYFTRPIHALRTDQIRDGLVISQPVS